MRLQFLGATGTVTGSKFHLTDGTHSWLVECGLFQGLRELRRRNWNSLPVDEKNLDAVILTHAHIDHTGYLPVLVKNGFTGPIFASEPTVELARILLPDAGYIEEEEARYAAKHGFSKHRAPMPLFTYTDALKTLDQLQPISDREWFSLSDNVRIMTRPSGHILGSRFINMSVDEKHRHFNIMFCGDIGRYDALISQDPGRVKSVNYLVLESTYGDRLHSGSDVFAQFEEIITRTIERSGKVIIPAFAVNRTQEVLYVLRKLEDEGRLPNVPIYLNSPLAIDATQIYIRYMKEKGFSEEQEFKRNGVPPEKMFHPSRLILVHDSIDSRVLNALEEPAIIISSSGMMTGGRILHHLKGYLPDPNSTVLLTGYQALGTRGRALMDGAKSVKIHGLDVPVRAEVGFVDSLSAHGDWQDIMRWLSGFEKPPKTTFLVHGEPTAAGALKEKIEKELGWKVVIPQYLEKVEL